MKAIYRSHRLCLVFDVIEYPLTENPVHPRYNSCPNRSVNQPSVVQCDAIVQGNAQVIMDYSHGGISDVLHPSVFSRTPGVCVCQTQ